VQNERQDQDNARGSDDLEIGLEEVAVAIDGFRTEEKLKVAGEVTDDEEKHHESRYRHDVFFAQR